jgi:hypothetical protein
MMKKEEITALLARCRQAGIRAKAQRERVHFIRQLKLTAIVEEQLRNNIKYCCQPSAIRQ